MVRKRLHEWLLTIPTVPADARRNNLNSLKQENLRHPKSLSTEDRNLESKASILFLNLTTYGAEKAAKNFFKKVCPPLSVRDTFNEKNCSPKNDLKNQNSNIVDISSPSNSFLKVSQEVFASDLHYLT